MAKTKATYHIIGGGLAGLSCAWYLKHKYPHIRSVIYEGSKHLGGRCYSYFDEGLSMPMDNALHAVTGANRFMSRFVKKSEWSKEKQFIDMDKEEINNSVFTNKELLLKSFCNTSENIPSEIKHNIVFSMFPFNKNQTKVYFSKQDLSPRIINVMAAYADEVHLNSKLTKISSQFGVAAQLEFGKKIVELGAKDRVILALDNLSYAKLMSATPLEHNNIVEINYHTSQTIFLPKGASFIGVKNGICDWVFSANNILTAIIYDYTGKSKDLSDLAREIWHELDKIRGVNSAFIPPFRAVCHKNATIKQNEKNNRLRPLTPQTEYPNIFIAGDWSMKDYPCCMETAFKSGIRAVKAALKA